MKHPAPCQYDSSITATNPETDFCTCPKATKEAGLRDWLVERIATVNGRMLQTEANVPEAIALSGSLTAYKAVLAYVKTRGIV